MPSAHSRFPHATQAILWMLAKGLVDTSIVLTARHLLDGSLHTFQIVFILHVAGLAILLPVMWAKGLRDMETGKMPLYSLRTVLEIAGFSLSFLGLAHLPVPSHTAIGFTSPVIASVLAILILKEPNYRHRWTALLIGLAGVLIVTRPGTEAFNPWSLCVIGSAAAFAGCGIVIKLLGRSEPPSRIVFYMMLLTTIGSLPFAMAVWQPLGWDFLPMALFLGLLSCGVQLCVTKAFQHADLTVLLPFAFLTLLWSSLGAWLFFDQIVSIWTIIGGSLIFAGAWYSVRMNRRLMPIAPPVQ